MKTLKRNILTVLVAMAIAVGVNAQDANKQMVNVDQIPQEVMTTFNTAFPETSNTQWKMKDDNYKVSFTMDGAEYHAMYDIEGNVISQGQKVDVAALPAEITNAARRDHPSHNINESHIIRKDDEVKYKISLTGSPDLKVYYSPDGTKLKDKVED